MLHEKSRRESYMAKKARGRNVVLAGVAVVSVIIGALINFAIDTPSAAWGASNSPARQGLFYMNAILIYVIPAIMGMLMFAKRREWLAQPGKYVETGRYSLFSPYALTASAVVAAVAVVAGLPGPINIDTVALVTAFAAVFFGPAVAFLATFVAFILRYLLGLAPWVATPNITVAYALMDGGIWAVSATLFWFIIRGFNLKGSVKTVATMIMAFVFMGIHFSGWVIVNYFTNNPLPAALGNMAWAIGPTGFVISSFVAQFMGTLIGAFYYDSRLVQAK